jgi:hypothetical protein
MKITKSLELLEGIIIRSKQHGWNIYFSQPDIGCYPSLQPLPKTTWAGNLVNLIKESEEE